MGTDKDFESNKAQITRFLKTSGCRGQTCKMQNKQKLSKFVKNEKFWEKTLMNRQKAHTEGKFLVRGDHINRWWTLWQRKKSVTLKANGPTKSFSYDLRTPKHKEKEIQKFLPHLISFGGEKSGREKMADSLFFALR